MELDKFSALPEDPAVFMNWNWADIDPYYQFLEEFSLSAANVGEWLAGWTAVLDRISEWYARLNVAITIDTTDAIAEGNYNAFLDEIYSLAQAADQKLKRKLLDSGLEPVGFEIPLRKMRVEATLFHPDNLPLLSEERKLASEYNKLIGAQTVQWGGEERTLQQLRTVLQDPQRATREQVWRLIANRQLADRLAINKLWQKLIPLRRQMAGHAGLPDYRAYRWAQMLRLDYTPQDCLQFQAAIEQVVTPAATRIYTRYRQHLGVERLRPWDLDQDLYPILQPPLSPYGNVIDLQLKAETVFGHIDAQLGEYFNILKSNALLDLENRKGKAPGAYCSGFPVTRRPFIFMNAVGLAGDVRTILHESGHAFHNFERLQLPYAQQRNPGLEFAEVASMAMELMALPYLLDTQGGFYSKTDANRFYVEQFEHILVFWPYMAVVDTFQHWVYTYADLALDPDACDAEWLQLWQRFIPGVDWGGLDAEAMTGWHRKQHIYRYPFYYVEYGMAQLGAVQVWRNALKDQTQALAQYRAALALGGTATLPELYQTAGAKFVFDTDGLQEAVNMIEAHLCILMAQ
jgi:oligoendopeptidase F